MRGIVRTIRAEWNHTTEFRGRRVAVRALSLDAPDFEDETLAIPVDGALRDLESEAPWLWASFISANPLGSLLTEQYPEDGPLITYLYRRGAVGMGRRQFFRPFYAPFSPEGAQQMLYGITELLEGDFRRPYSIPTPPRHSRPDSGQGRTEG